MRMELSWVWPSISSGLHNISPIKTLTMLMSKKEVQGILFRVQVGDNGVRKRDCDLKVCWLLHRRKLLEWLPTLRVFELHVSLVVLWPKDKTKGLVISTFHSVCTRFAFVAKSKCYIEQRWSHHCASSSKKPIDHTPHGAKDWKVMSKKLLLFLNDGHCFMECGVAEGVWSPDVLLFALFWN